MFWFWKTLGGVYNLYILLGLMSAIVLHPEAFPIGGCDWYPEVFHIWDPWSWIALNRGGKNQEWAHVQPKTMSFLVGSGSDLSTWHNWVKKTWK